MCAVRVRVWYMPLRGLFDATISFIDALTALKLAFEIMHECMLYPHQSESSWHLHWVGEWVASVSEESYSLFHHYRDEIYSLQILLSRTQAGPGRTVKQEQEEISLNHVKRINLISVHRMAKKCADFVKQQPGRARQNS